MLENRDVEELKEKLKEIAELKKQKEKMEEANVNKEGENLSFIAKSWDENHSMNIMVFILN